MVIVAHNAERRLPPLLRSLLATDYDDFIVIVIDSGSSDATARVAKEHLGAAGKVVSISNQGYAWACNAGLALAESDGCSYVVFCNDDILFPEPSWLAEAVKAAESDPTIGVVGFCFVDSPHLLVDSDVRIRPVPRVEGCCFLVPTCLFHRIGTFDTCYFMYGEEDDFQARAQRAGYHSVQVPSRIWHKGMAAAASYPRKIQYLQIRNAIRFAIKNRPYWRVLARLVAVIDIACNPVPLLYRPGDVAHRRMRGRARLAENLLLCCAAIGWNLLFLPETLRWRWRDNRRAKRCRQMPIGAP